MTHDEIIEVLNLAADELQAYRDYSLAGKVRSAATQLAAPASEPVAWLATDLDGRGDVAFTVAEAQKRAGEGCKDMVPLYAAPQGEGK